MRIPCIAITEWIIVDSLFGVDGHVVFRGTPAVEGDDVLLDSCSGGGNGEGVFGVRGVVG